MHGHALTIPRPDLTRWRAVFSWRSTCCMAMTRSIADQCLALAWSQWVALGVSGTAPAADHAVSLETAMVFGSTMKSLDRRLYDEIADWCDRYASEFVSVSTLRHVLSWFDRRQQASFTEFVGEHGLSKLAGRLGIEPRAASRLSGKSTCRTEHPAAIQLRARKLFGIGAKADILVRLVLEPPTEPSHWSRAAELATLGYEKKTITDAMHDLELGGLVDEVRRANASHYKLRDRAGLAQLLAPLPAPHFPLWQRRLALAASLAHAEQSSRTKSAISRAVEIKKALTEHRKTLAILGFGVDQPPVKNIEQWIEPLLRP